jgi:hypothetical protein
MHPALSSSPSQSCACAGPPNPAAAQPPPPPEVFAHFRLAPPEPPKPAEPAAADGGKAKKGGKEAGGKPKDSPAKGRGGVGGKDGGKGSGDAAPPAVGDYAMAPTEPARWYLEPGEAATFQVTFAASAVGAVEGVLTFGVVGSPRSSPCPSAACATFPSWTAARRPSSSPVQARPERGLVAEVHHVPRPVRVWAPARRPAARERADGSCGAHRERLKFTNVGLFPRRWPSRSRRRPHGGRGRRGQGGGRAPVAPAPAPAAAPPPAAGALAGGRPPALGGPHGKAASVGLGRPDAGRRV